MSLNFNHSSLSEQKSDVIRGRQSPLQNNSKSIQKPPSPVIPTKPQEDSLHPLSLPIHFDSKKRKDFYPSWSPFFYKTVVFRTRSIFTVKQQYILESKEDTEVASESHCSILHYCRRIGHGKQSRIPAPTLPCNPALYAGLHTQQRVCWMNGWIWASILV